MYCISYFLLSLWTVKIRRESDLHSINSEVLTTSQTAKKTELLVENYYCRPFLAEFVHVPRLRKGCRPLLLHSWVTWNWDRNRGGPADAFKIHPFHTCCRSATFLRSCTFLKVICWGLKRKTSFIPHAFYLVWSVASGLEFSLKSFAIQGGCVRHYPYELFIRIGELSCKESHCIPNAM